MEHKITCPVCGDTHRCFEEQQEHENVEVLYCD